MTEFLSPNSKLLIGRKLSGRYVLSSLISSGQFTQIWAATDLVLSREVAVKLTNPDLVSETQFLSKFRSEARLISRLNHPSIVAILDTTGDDEIEAIVMELVEEETLGSCISRMGSLSISSALPIFNHIVDALSYAHNQGLVHGDLSPEKIFLCPDRGTKISGFGLTESIPFIKEKKGGSQDTISPFQSPEVQAGSIPDQKNDIYSLGKLLLFILTGTVNSSPDNHGSFPITAEILRAISKATALDPTQRYSSVVDFKDDLESKMVDTEEAPSESTSARRSQPINGHLLFTRFLTFGMVFTFVLGIIFATNLDDSLFGSSNSDSTPSNSSSDANDSPAPAASSNDQTSDEETSSDSTEEAATETQEPSVSPIFEMVSVVEARDYDPLGDGVEHPELLGNLLDEDSSTIWYSETYANRSLGGLKDGVGLVIELQKSFPIQTVDIETTNSDWSGEIYVSENIGANLAAWGASAASISAAQGNATIDLTGITGSAILIWFTDLGDASPPGVRMEISEIEVS